LTAASAIPYPAVARTIHAVQRVIPSAASGGTESMLATAYAPSSSSFAHQAAAVAAAAIAPAASRP
jgi:hypothetical protein